MIESPLHFFSFQLRPTFGGKVLTRFWISLKLGCCLSAMSWNRMDSVVVTMAPATRSRSKAKARSVCDLIVIMGWGYHQRIRGIFKTLGCVKYSGDYRRGWVTTSTTERKKRRRRRRLRGLVWANQGPSVARKRESPRQTPRSEGNASINRHSGNTIWYQTKDNWAAKTMLLLCSPQTLLKTHCDHNRNA